MTQLRLFSRLVACLGVALLISCGEPGEEAGSGGAQTVDMGPASSDATPIDATPLADVADQAHSDGGAGSDASADTGSEDAGGEPACPSDEHFFTHTAWPQVLEAQCTSCHQAGGQGADTRFALTPNTDAEAIEQNLSALRLMARAELDGVSLLILKASGEHPDGHGGAASIMPDSAEYEVLAELAARLRAEVDECGETVLEATSLHPSGECDELAPGRRLMRRLSHSEYRNTIHDLLGLDVDAEAAFVADPIEYGFDNHPELLHVQGLLADQYRRMAESIGGAVEVEDLLPCELEAADLSCGHRFIAEFGLRAFRRPLTETEIGAYRALFSTIVTEECFEQAARWVVTAMLQSPHFLYRMELGRRTELGFELTSYELATQLSYLIWRSMPDQALFDSAADGSLLEPAVLRRQVRRLIHSPRSAEMVADFMGKWLGTKDLMHVVRDAVVYADLDLDLREAMLEENRRFVTDLWRRNRPYTDLFTAQHSWLSPELAAHYGQALDGVEEDESFRRVELDATRPGGVLTQGAFLTTHASPTSSSPIMRGLTVRERLLCEELSLPAFAIPELPEDAGPDATTRERFAAHTENELCQGCHVLIDPIGFGFEHYDGIGRYREMDGSQPVDASGSLVRVGQEETPFHGVGELASLLANDSQVKACFARQWFRYGFGENESVDVACHVDALADALMQKEDRLKAVITALTTAPHFRQRSGEVRELDVLGSELVPTDPGVPAMSPDPALPPDGLEMLVCGEEPQRNERAEAGDPRIEIAVREDRWDHGYCQYLTLTNVGDEHLEGWEIQRDIEGTISNTWGAFRDADSGTVTFINLPENATLEPGHQAQLGFCATL